MGLGLRDLTEVCLHVHGRSPNENICLGDIATLELQEQLLFLLGIRKPPPTEEKRGHAREG